MTGGIGRPVAPVHTTRLWRTWKQQATEWVMSTTATLATLLLELQPGTERVYICGPRPGGDIHGWRAWLAAPLPLGWSVHRDGHWIENEQLPTLRFRAPDGRKVTIMRAAVWFGDGRYGPEHAARAWAMLELAVARAWRSKLVGLLATPATTGRDLWQRTITRDRTWRVPDTDAAEWLRTTGTQGRWEWLAGPDTPWSQGLSGIDMRFAYAACCTELGGNGRLVDGDELDTGVVELHTPGRLDCTVRVPADWDHIGLLPRLAGDDWTWPAERGRRFRTTADTAELALAVEHGWSIERVHQGYVMRRGRPLDTWAHRLVDIVRVLGQWEAHGTLDATSAALARGGLRMMLLSTIGAFHGSAHTVTRYAPTSEPGAVPAHASHLRMDGHNIVWRETQDAKWPEMRHPEWSTRVWARCRRRLAQEALRVPRRQLVALRQDAIYATSFGRPYPEHVDKPGAWRRVLRRQSQPPLSSAVELAAIIREARR